MQVDGAHSALKQGDDLKPVFDQVYNKVVTGPANALQPLIPAAQVFTSSWCRWVIFVAQQNTQVSFVANGIQFPTSQQASQYNALIWPAKRLSTRRSIRRGRQPLTRRASR